MAFPAYLHLQSVCGFSAVSGPNFASGFIARSGYSRFESTCRPLRGVPPDGPGALVSPLGLTSLGYVNVAPSALEGSIAFPKRQLSTYFVGANQPQPFGE